MMLFINLTYENQVAIQFLKTFWGSMPQLTACLYFAIFVRCGTNGCSLAPLLLVCASQCQKQLEEIQLARNIVNFINK